MKTKLIELLNKLIDKGWSPFGYHEGKYGYNEIEYFNNELTLSFGEGAGKFIRTYSLRNISSIDSGLWQFVCENKLFPKNRGHKRENDLGNGEIYYEDERQYYVIESALCDEDKLEQFLLDKIKIGNEN